MGFDSVMERLAVVAEKYLDIAEKTSDTKVASRALGVVEKSLGLAKKVDRNKRASQDPVAQFLSFVHYPVKRSVLWLEFLEFCREFRFKPVPKGNFFDRMRRLGFLPVDRGDIIIIPPEGKNRAILPKSELPYEFVAESSPIKNRTEKFTRQIGGVRRAQADSRISIIQQLAADEQAIKNPTRK